MPPKNKKASPGQTPARKNVAQTRVATKKTTSGTPKAKTPAGKNAGKTTSKTKADVKPKVTKESLAAVKIQSVLRRFLARKKLLAMKKEKIEYEELIEKLQKEAWLEIVKREREEEDRKRQKEESVWKRKALEKKRIKFFLESSFDGELEDMKKVLKELEEDIKKTCDFQGENLKRKIEKSKSKLINCEDANGNSALSEASLGGSLETVTFLLDHGAIINSIGQFHRTPLYRAAFGGHLDVLKKLLESGGDPRILDMDGVLAEQVAATPEVVNLLQDWDVAVTDKLLLKLQETENQHKSKEEAFVKEQMKIIESEIVELETDYSNKQKILRKVYTELNKRITEHDKAVTEGFERTDVTLQSIHDAEIDLARAQREEEESRKKLFAAKLRLREEKASENGDDDPRIVKCNLKELDQVLILDVGDVLKNSGKWPLLLDSSNQAATFLRYRDTNYLNLLNPKDVEIETLRKALLGALRFGKSLVLDMLEVDMLNFLEGRLNEIQDNLYKDLMNKELISTKRYVGLIRDVDGKEYRKENFTQARLDRFQLIIVNKMFDPPDAWLDIFHTIRIVTQCRD